MAASSSRVAMALLAPLVALLCAHAFEALWTLFDDRFRCFATSTNGCYVACGLVLHWQGGAPRARLDGLRNPALLYVLLGASSAAFHASSARRGDADLGAPAHALDVALGWTLVVHCAYATSAVLVAQLGTPCAGAVAAIEPLLLAAAVVALLFDYDATHDAQLAVFGASVSVALVSAVVSRANADAVGCSCWHAPYLAEIGVLALAAAAAVYAQGELLGQQLRCCADGRYDVFHGVWHYLVASVTVVLYVRVADAVRSAPLPVKRRPPLLDAPSLVALGVLGAYAATAWLLKEATSASVAACHAALASVATLGVAAVGAAWWWCRAPARGCANASKAASIALPAEIARCDRHAAPPHTLLGRPAADLPVSSLLRTAPSRDLRLATLQYHPI